MMDPVVIYDKLKDLSADEIAQHLKHEGIRGLVGNPFHCPLANYFNRHATQACEVHWDRIRWVARDSEAVQTYDCPTGVAEFVLFFDDGEYPDLCCPDMTTDV